MRERSLGPDLRTSGLDLEWRERMRCPSLRHAVPALLILGGLSASAAAVASPLDGVRRVVFLGDSNTYAGGYVEDIEAVLRAQNPGLACEFLNLGLPSETVSGLSEPGHAGGQFPRPELRERLGRVLAKTKPDLIVACYGMNCGMYYPFAEERFAKFQEGVRHLRDQAKAEGARLLIVTPPVFDPEPIRAQTLPAGLAEYRRPFDGYDDVLRRYSEWLIARRAQGWEVVDAHGPTSAYLAEQRRKDPSFRLAGDGVHLNAEGHWLIARAILLHWGVPDEGLAKADTVEQALAGLPHGTEILPLVRRRQRLLKDAWLTATGHTRPGMAKGLPLADAERQAGEADAKIRAILKPSP